MIKRRRSTLDEPIIPTKKRLNLKYRVGGLTRKFFRYVFEHKAVKKLLGTNIAFMLIVSSFIPTNTLGNTNVGEIISIDGAEAPIHTNIAIQNPVDNDNMIITQGYKLFHPGLDIDGITGDTVKPIKKGMVETVEFSNVGYGKHVIIDHGNNLKSLYAHLSKIYIKEGDEVDTNAVLGEMGSSGYSFGDHLHLEVRDHGIPINPLSVLN
ncbi:MAG: M23 family metallopeptidase [Candidatus Woesebacteria bacterium]|nr:M23 family metallopeptidase [Candidatus Woesebacteria bacterium]